MNAEKKKNEEMIEETAEMEDTETPGPSEEVSVEASAEDTPAPASSASSEIAPDEEDPGLPKKWYVVHTYSGHENKVRENIQKMINTSSIADSRTSPTNSLTESR